MKNNQTRSKHAFCFLFPCSLWSISNFTLCDYLLLNSSNWITFKNTWELISFKKKCNFTQKSQEQQVKQACANKYFFDKLYKYVFSIDYTAL